MFKKFLINYAGFSEDEAGIVQCVSFLATLVTFFILFIVLIIRIGDKLLTFYGF